MVAENNLDKIAPPAPEAVPSHDNLSDVRGADPRLLNAVYTQNTGDANLVPMQISAGQDQPYNPQHIPGTYNPQDLAIANQLFTKPEVKALEEVGPQNFNAMMEALKNTEQSNPQQFNALKTQFKNMADATVKIERSHPNVPRGNGAT